MIRGRLLSSVWVLLMQMFSLILAQRPTYERELIVMLKPGAVELPAGLSQAPLPQVSVADSSLKNALERTNTELIMKAFPNFRLADTLAVSRTGQVVQLTNRSNIYKIRLPEPASIRKAAADLSNFPEVIYAEPNGKAIPLQVYPNDPNFDDPNNAGQGGYQWNLLNTGQDEGTNDADIDAPEAWEITTGSSTTKIGVIDYGVWSSHPDLTGKVSGDAGYGFIDRHHGTRVAGVVAAKTNNSKGIAGVDWNAQIISQRLDTGVGDNDTYNAIMDAVNAGAQIINNSWSLCGNCNETPPTPRYSTTVRLAFVDAYKLNVVAAAAMGNWDSGSTYYPAGFGQGIIAIGATNRTDMRWISTTNTDEGSNFGNHIDVVAPGEDILSTATTYNYTYGGRYNIDSGTSYAVPHVSGVAGLLLAVNTNLYNDDIEQIIMLSADEVPGMAGENWTQYYGTGRVNARKALDLIRSPNVLRHWSATGGSITWSTWSNYQDFYGLECGFGDGTYVVERHRVEKTVTFPHSFNSPPYVWGRGVATVGYSAADPNFTIGWCEVVSGTVTKSRARLRTYIYDVYFEDPVDGYLDFLCTVPASAPNVVFGYTALGVPLGPSGSATLPKSLPKSFALRRNYPNPLNPVTTIHYDLPEPSDVILTIHDFLGREVETLVNGTEQAGSKHILWDGTDRYGSAVASGVYIYKIMAKSLESERRFTGSRKMVLVR